MREADSKRFSATPHGDREVVMTRHFNAAPRQVFDVWAKPDVFTRWFEARGFTLPVCEMDARPGGKFRHVMHGPDGMEVTMNGTFIDVVPPGRLVTTEAFEGFTEPGWRPEDRTQTTAIFTEEAGGTRWTATVLYPSQEIRDAALQLDPAWEGAAESYDRLEEVVQEVL
jgi:uncharacterized protein YndB with AHSA1/START domain